MPQILVPDLSEWEGAVEWPALVGWQRSQFGGSAAIIRAYNGTREDYYWARNRDGALAAGVDVLGIYAYLLPSVNATTQAASFCATLGQLLPGEFPILDIEAGSGDQSGRAREWMTTVQAAEHAAGWQYSGVAFARAANLGADGVPANRTWIAAYQSGEPASPGHEMWQFTDSATVPGVSGPCDLSLFHGTTADLLALINPHPSEVPMPALAIGQVGPGFAFDEHGIEIDGTKATVLVTPPANGGLLKWGTEWLSLGCDFGSARIRVAIHDGKGWTVTTENITALAGRLAIPLPNNVGKVSLARCRTSASDTADAVPVGWLIEAGAQ